MQDTTFLLPFNPKGINPICNIVGEPVQLFSPSIAIVFPQWGAYFSDTVNVYRINSDQSKTKLSFTPIELIDHESMMRISRPIHCGLIINCDGDDKNIFMDYTALGGDDQPNVKKLYEIMDNIGKLRAVDWNEINHPKLFNPKKHLFDMQSLYGTAPIVNKIKSVSEAIGIGDAAIENEIITYKFTQEEEFIIQTYDDSLQTGTDVVDTTIIDTRSLLVKTNDIGIDTKNAIKRIKILLDDIDEKYKYYKTNKENDIYAMTLAGLTKRQALYNNTLTAVPELIQGLDLWVDFNDVSTHDTNQGFSIRDKGKSRIFSSSENRIIKDSKTGKNICKMDGVYALKQTSGEPFNLGDDCTIIYVTMKNNNEDERIDIFSNSSSYFGIDVQNRILLEQSKNLLKTHHFVAPCPPKDLFSSHAVCCVLDKENVYSRVLSNAPFSNYNTFNGFTYEPMIDKSGQTYPNIGSLTKSLSGSIAEIIVYKRKLSVYEIDCLEVYLNYKYGIKFNYVANGGFTLGLSDFETDYKASKLCQNSGEIAAPIRESIAYMSPDSNGIKTAIDWPQVYRAMVPYTKMLFVNSEANKAFWRQSIKLQTGVSYLLKFNLLYEPNNAPTLKVSINGVTSDKDILLPNTTCLMKNIEVYIISYDKQCVIELSDTGDTTLTRVFAVDDLSLSRCVEV